MSDVSGIPYMGPMGQGNFFAPSFSYNPQMSAGQISSTYMPEIANNQNVVNNLFNTPGGGGGFGRATDYYSALGAQYLNAVPRSWENPYTHGAIVPQSLRVEGGNYANGSAGSGWGGSVFDQGAMNNFALGGGGYSFPSIPNFSSGSGGGSAPAINWDTMFQQSGGGLGGSPRLGLDDLQHWAGNWNMPQGGGLFGGGGAHADPFPNMAMPGGLNSPMTMPQQRPLDYGSLFGRGVGGATAEPYPTTSTPSALDAPMTGAPSSSLDWSTLFSGGADTGMTMPGGLNSPMTVPEQQAPAYDYGSMFGKGTGGAAQPAPDGTRTYDFAPMYEAGGGGGFGSGGGDTAGLFGATAPSLGGDAFSYNKDPMWQDTAPDALAAQARARLAGIMGSGDTEPLEPGVSPREAAVPELPAELPTGSDVPLPRERPAGADAPRPPETVPAAAPPVEPPAPLPKGAARPPARVAFTVEPGKEERVAGVNPRLRTAVEGGAQFLPPGYSVEVFSGVRYPTPEHKQAFHRIIDGSGRAMDVRIIGPDGPITPQGNDYTGMYTLLARGVKTWAAQNDPGSVSGYGGAFETSRGSGQPDLMHFDQGPNRGSLRPDVQYDTLRPLSEVERNAMPAYIPILGENQVPLDRSVPLGAGYSAPVPPLTDRALPTVPSYRASGMSARDFAAPVRFGGEFGGDEFSGQMPTPGAFTPYADFRQSADFENRTTEQPGRDQLATFQTQGNYAPEPEVAPTPMGNALGLGDLLRSEEPEVASTPLGIAAGLEDLGRATAPAVPTRDDLAASDRYSDALYGRDTNPVDAAIRESAPATGMDFAYWKAIADIESSLNPASNQNATTQYKGLYQLGSRATDPEWATHGMGDIYNPMDNALAASRLFQYNAERFKSVYGRDPTPGEAYVLHNQGLGFFTRNLAPAGNNVPGGHGFTVPPTHDTFLTDWTRYLEEKAAGYR